MDWTFKRTDGRETHQLFEILIALPTSSHFVFAPKDEFCKLKLEKKMMMKEEKFVWNCIIALFQRTVHCSFAATILLFLFLYSGLRL